MSDSEKTCGGKPNYFHTKDELWFLENLSKEELDKLYQMVVPKLDVTKIKLPIITGTNENKNKKD